MFCFHETTPKEDLGKGIVVQILGSGTTMNTWHWNMRDGSVVSLHQHPQEQFGYVIRGGFRMSVGDEESVLKAGDAYFIPPNVPHMFVAVGETEAIDVFSPKRVDIPWRT